MPQIKEEGYYLPNYDQEIEYVDDELTPKKIDFTIEEIPNIIPRVAVKILAELTKEEQALLVGSYAEYEPGRKERYEKDEIFSWKGKLYQVIQPHNSEGRYDPSSIAYSALYKSFLPDDIIDEWKQPQGGHDAYKLGDKVTYKGQIWESTANANVWQPGVHGWKLV